MTRGGEDIDPTDVGVPLVPDEFPVMPAPRSSVDPGPSGPPASDESRRAWMDQIRHEHGWIDRVSPAEREALRARQCPTCRQPAGQGCVVPGTTRARGVHEARLMGAKA